MEVLDLQGRSRGELQQGPGIRKRLSPHVPRDLDAHEGHAQGRGQQEPYPYGPHTFDLRAFLRTTPCRFRDNSSAAECKATGMEFA